jgi:hypothetical protein
MHESWDGDWKHAIISNGLMYCIVTSLFLYGSFVLVNVDRMLNQFWGCKYYVGDVLVCLLEVGDNLTINVERGNFEGVFF